MLDWFDKLFVGLWLTDLLLYPLAACLILALIRLIYKSVGCRY